MQKSFNAGRELVRRGYARTAAVGTGLSAAFFNAFAALPTSLATDATTAKTDGLELFGMVVGAIMIIALLCVAARKVGAK
jgi:hypothetical protein